MIEFVDLSTAQELDHFVTAHANCHFMQTSNWGRIKLDWSWQGIIYRDRNREIKGTIALLSRRLKGLNACILYAPRGPIYDHEDYHTLFKLLEASKQLAHQIHAVVLRIDPMIAEDDSEFASYMKNEGFCCNRSTDYSLFQPRMCYVMELTEEADLASRYHRTTRYHLNRAIKEGVTVKSDDDVDSFYALMTMTAAHNGFAMRELAYFKRFLDILGEHARLYLAKQNGEVIAGSIAVFYGKRAWFMYGASDPKKRKSHPNELLQWTMQNDAIKKGCKYFDMRGVEGYPAEDHAKLGLHQFKQGFSANFVAYAGEFDYILRPWLYYATKVYGKLKR